MGFSLLVAINIIPAEMPKETIEHINLNSSVVFFCENRFHIGVARK